MCDERIRFTLIVRDGCHLCDDMRDALAAFAAELGFTWNERDVDGETALRQRFHTLVPVLMLGDQMVCHHFLDGVALRQAVRGARGGA